MVFGGKGTCACRALAPPTWGKTLPRARPRRRMALAPNSLFEPATNAEMPVVLEALDSAPRALDFSPSPFSWDVVMQLPGPSGAEGGPEGQTQHGLPDFRVVQRPAREEPPVLRLARSTAHDGKAWKQHGHGPVADRRACECRDAGKARACAWGEGGEG